MTGATVRRTLSRRTRLGAVLAGGLVLLLAAACGGGGGGGGGGGDSGDLQAQAQQVGALLDQIEALIAMMSFQTWRTLRRDQALTVEDEGSVLAHMVTALTAAMPGR